MDSNEQEWKRQRLLNLMQSAVLCLLAIGQAFLAIGQAFLAIGQAFLAIGQAFLAIRTLGR